MAIDRHVRSPYTLAIRLTLDAFICDCISRGDISDHYWCTPYTVGETPTESPDTVVRMGSGARSRLNAPVEFDATVDAQVVQPTYSDAEAKAASEFVERLTDDGAHRGSSSVRPTAA